MVLQRKVEEAFMATKRLNDLFESRKASPHEKGIGAGNIIGEKDQDQAKKEKNDAKLQIRGICSKYEKQLQEISGIANGKNALKNDTEVLDQIDIGSLLQDIDNDCQKKDLEIRDLLQEVRNNHRGKESEIRDLKEQVAKLRSMVRQLDMEKEPRKRVEGSGSGLSDVTNLTGLSQSEGTAGIAVNLYVRPTSVTAELLVEVVGHHVAVHHLKLSETMQNNTNVAAKPALVKKTKKSKDSDIDHCNNRRNNHPYKSIKSTQAATEV
ncbi:hypothetical protein QQ045_018284 [Rhodiola kirilowii]